MHLRRKGVNRGIGNMVLQLVLPYADSRPHPAPPSLPLGSALYLVYPPTRVCLDYKARLTAEKPNIDEEIQGGRPHAGAGEKQKPPHLTRSH